MTVTVADLDVDVVYTGNSRQTAHLDDECPTLTSHDRLGGDVDIKTNPPEALFSDTDVCETCLSDATVEQIDAEEFWTITGDRPAHIIPSCHHILTSHKAGDVQEPDELNADKQVCLACLRNIDELPKTDADVEPYLWRHRFEDEHAEYDILHLPIDSEHGDSSDFWEKNGGNVTIVSWGDRR